MDFSAFVGWMIVFIILMVLLNIQTYHKALWEKILFPGLILMSVFTTVPVSALLYAACYMAGKPGVTVMEKILYGIAVAGIIVFLIWLNVKAWKKWKREQSGES